MKLRLALLSAAALLVAGLGTPAAHAVLNGTPDGNDHPNVGAVLNPEAFSDGTWALCSGSLVSPTVFLTAAHCDPALYGYDTGGQATFTLDSHYVAGSSQTYTGTFHSDPAWPGTHADPHDIAVIVLDEPITGVTPVKLPQADSLDSLPAGTPVVGVGYGANTKDGRGYTWSDTRFEATGSLMNTGGTWLRINENAARGLGGGCFGDSGGPNFVGDVQVATTLSGDAICQSVNAAYRLDTPSARDFLGQFVTLP